MSDSPVPFDRVPLDPTIAEFLARAQERMSSLDAGSMGVAELRRQSDALGTELFKEVAEPGPDVESVSRLDADGVPVNIYRPFTSGPHGLYVLIHGGGWWQGSIKDWISDVQCRERAIGADCVVAAVEYRLAPEHPFPAGLEDCFTAWCWLRDHAEELGVDPARMVLGGVSAGGNLAAALTLLLRERGQAQPALAVFEAGVMDFSLDYPSYRELGTGYGLETAAMPGLIAMYAPDPAEHSNPLISPVRAASFVGLCPAHFMTCELDPTHDASDVYADRLSEAGVSVTRTQHAGHIHQSPVMTKILPSARVWRDEVHRVVGDAVRSTVVNEPAAL